MTSKQEERKALIQIRKIVEGLGENSYIGMALEGCFEIAEQNIENDFGCSMKQRAEAAEKNAAKLQEQVERLKNVVSIHKTDNDNLCNEILSYKGQIQKHAKRISEAEDALVEANRAANRQAAELEMADAKIKELQNEIIQLKAKLYDLLVK